MNIPIVQENYNKALSLAIPSHNRFTDVYKLL